MTVDVKVWSLAELFISDYRSENEDIDKARVDELADMIQETIEGFISEIKDRNKDLEKCRTRKD
jgi:hypothetical protein